MSEFVDHLSEVFSRFGTIKARKMFGGHGIYHDGVMFALVADEILYLKADNTIAAYFESAGLPQFEYDKGDKIVKMSYYRAPDEIYDDPDRALSWARRSYEVAFRTKARSKAKKKK